MPGTEEIARQINASIAAEGMRRQLHIHDGPIGACWHCGAPKDDYIHKVWIGSSARA